MYQSIERPMTDDERRRLLDCLPPARSPFRSLFLNLEVVGELVAVTVAVTIVTWIRQDPVRLVIPMAVGVYAVWWMLHLKSRVLRPLRRYRERNERPWAFRDAVQAARTVRVQRVESDLVIEIEDHEGTICLFDVGENRSYWINPELMVPGDPPRDWPNRLFEVVEVPGWNEHLGPFCYGTQLCPRETIEFRELFENDDFKPRPDGLIHQSLDEFVQAANDRNRS